MLYQDDTFLAVLRRVNFKKRSGIRICYFSAQHRRGLIQGSRVDLRAGENLPDVVVNRRIIVDDQDAMLHTRAPIFISIDFGADNGISSTNVAPLPGPSLAAESEPPISLAANAPLCSPN